MSLHLLNFISICSFIYLYAFIIRTATTRGPANVISVKEPNWMINFLDYFNIFFFS